MLSFLAYASHDLRGGGGGKGHRGIGKKILHLNLYIKEINNIFWGDRGKAAGLFIRVGFFAGGFFA